SQHLQPKIFDQVITLCSFQSLEKFIICNAFSLKLRNAFRLKEKRKVVSYNIYGSNYYSEKAREEILALSIAEISFHNISFERFDENMKDPLHKKFLGEVVMKETASQRPRL